MDPGIHRAPEPRRGLVRCDGYGYSSRPGTPPRPGPVRWIRVFIAPRRPAEARSGAMDSGIHRAPAPVLAWLGAMDSGIQQGNRVWIRVSIAASGRAGAMDPGI